MVLRWHWLVPYVFLAAFVLLFFHQLAFTELILARGDTYNYFYPYWDVRNAAFRAGELPLWSSDLFMGIPLLANSQIGTFYPPNWLTAPFSAPDAIRYSILGHLIWAAWGAYTLFRATVSNKILPALLAALLFLAGGYLGAHVEQINQLQGLASLPWLVLLYHYLLTKPRKVLWGLLLAMLWALQIFSGHTQTVFITGVGLGIYGLAYAYQHRQNRFPLKQLFAAMLSLATVALLTVLLALPQILPTLELTGMSNRGSGFKDWEAVSFSMPPWYLPRSLLGVYEGQLFTEYIISFGVIALLLALLGALGRAEGQARPLVWLLFGGIALSFALGAYNPLYWGIAKLPGFNLFRVPARWLVLVALALSILAGRGLLLIQTGQIKRTPLFIASAILASLMLLTAFLPIEAVHIQGLATASWRNIGLWAVLLGTCIMFFVLAPLHRNGEGNQRGGGQIYLTILIIGAIVLELFLIAEGQAYQDLAPREIYEGQRFTISQLLAYGDEISPQGRTLSLTNLYFDTGDKEQVRRRYESLGMDEAAIQTAFTATKNQEMLMPNLALTWGIPTLDGYDGGILPTIYYSQFTSLLLPEGVLRTVDGRLGEMLSRPECRYACIPDHRWLYLTDTQYLLTDKLQDIWHEGIAYDTFMPTRPTTERSVAYQTPHNLAFVADEVRILYTGATAPSFFTEEIGALEARYVSDIQDFHLGIVQLDRPRALQGFSLSAGYDAATGKETEGIYAVTLVHSPTGLFTELSPAAWERVLSSDIKVYRPDTDGSLSTYIPRRATVVHRVIPAADDWQGHEDALVLMRDWRFNPILQAVIHGEDVQAQDSQRNAYESQAEFISYSPTRIELAVNAAEAGYLILADAYYPHWQATVNGESTRVYRADVMFRAVRVPAGTSRVVFEFVPHLWYQAMSIGGVVWLMTGLACLLLLLKGRFLQRVAVPTAK